MNPFERLRQAIDKVNIAYQFQEEQPQEAERDEPVYQPTKQPQEQQLNDPNEFNRIKDLYSNTQNSHLKEISSLTAKIEQMTKQIRRSEATIEAQMNDIVSLQKENELLKENLNEQYRNIVVQDERERKLKEEIYRVNVTVNELATEINTERNQKKQLIKELEAARLEASQTSECWKDAIKKVQEERDRFKSELQERIQMFEYNVKKNADDRKEYKSQLTKQQQAFQKNLQSYRTEIDKIKKDLFESQKQAEILSLKKQNLEEQLERTNIKLQQSRQSIRKYQEEVRVLSSKYQEILKNNEALERNNSSLGSQLQEEKKNVKVKVVQVRDQTILMELQMYKRQCKQLMQERAIINSINRSQRSIEPGYKIVSTQALPSK